MFKTKCNHRKARNHTTKLLCIPSILSNCLDQGANPVDVTLYRNTNTYLVLSTYSIQVLVCD